MQKYGLAFLPWSPVAGGILAGRYQPGAEFPADSRAAREVISSKAGPTPKGTCVAAKVAEMAKERGMTSAQLALLWLKRPAGSDFTDHRATYDGAPGIVYCGDGPEVE